MEAWISGNVAGTGTFRCTECDYALSLDAVDELPTCPNCGGKEFVRASLFTTAASPTSPLNPFSADFRDIRIEGISLFERVITGCRPRVTEDAAAELPFLLWAFNLAFDEPRLRVEPPNRPVGAHAIFESMARSLREPGLPAGAERR